MKRLVVGCGYLGLRVAKRWVAAGDKVYGVTRSPQRAEQFREIGIEPVVADLTQPETIAGLPEVDTVLFAVGMDRSKYSDIRLIYVDGLRHVLNNLPNSVKQFVYISSTGVYGDFGGEWVDEFSPTKPQREGGKACLEAERLIADSSWAARSTILRLAGIYGPQRVPTRQQIESRDWSKLSPEGYLNLIHVDDAADIVIEVAAQGPAGETYLVSDGNPALRRDYYDYLAQTLKLGPIPWDPQAVTPSESRSSSSKRIGNRKLLEQFSIRLRFPDCKAGLSHAMGKSAAEKNP